MPNTPRIAVVDYGMGNLYSVCHACRHVGLGAFVTGDPEEVFRAGAVILPGVGAFGDAMATLRSLGMVEALRNYAATGKLLFGICLGLQLLMERSYEFGEHEGLGLIPGEVVRFPDAVMGVRKIKVPQIGWNRVKEARPGAWVGTPLEPLRDGVYQYFVHSYIVRPALEDFVVARTVYGDVAFCSAAAAGNIFACQFHPERSGPQGIQIYKQFAALVSS